MLIRSLELRNFRAFETLKIELNPKLSVIVGQNGTGKTTILEAAAIASGTLLHGFDGVANYGIKRGMRIINILIWAALSMCSHSFR